MKLKPLLIATPLAMLCASAFAAHLPTDSVGVENQDGKKVILHKLDPKDNYYSIGRRYNVKPAAIMQYNNNALLHVGAIIKVPTDVPFVQSSAPVQQQFHQTTVYQPRQNQQPPVQQQTQQPVNTPAPANTQQYKVSAGETLFAIAKRFNVSVNDLVSLNNLRSNSLTPGQIILVPTGSPAPQQSVSVTTANIPVAARDSTQVATDSSTVERRLPANRYGLFEKNEKGVATWMDDTGLDPNKRLVLHRTAPIGTVIKITNPMTSRTTFAKVVGRFTDNESTKDVIVVMTKGTAESIGALDKRFHVNISYGVPNE